MGLQRGLFGKAGLVGPHVFHYSQKSAWHRVGIVEYTVGIQSLSTKQQNKWLMRNLSLLSNYGWLLNMQFFFFNLFEIVSFGYVSLYVS